MADHFIDKGRKTTGFSASHDPQLRVRAGAGDQITFQTDDAAYAQMGRGPRPGEGDRAAEPGTGPVYVDAAHAGEALAVTIHDITLEEHSWSVYLPGAGGAVSDHGRADGGGFRPTLKESISATTFSYHRAND